MAGAVEEEKELPKSERGRGSRQSFVLEPISSGGFFFFFFYRIFHARVMLPRDMGPVKLGARSPLIFRIIGLLDSPTCCLHPLAILAHMSARRTKVG